MSLENGNRLIVKDFSFVHLFASLMSLFWVLLLNWGWLSGEKIDFTNIWFIVLNIVFVAAVFGLKTFSITTVFDKEKQNISSCRYTIFGRYTSKLNFKDIIKLDIRDERWGKTRKSTLLISIGDSSDDIPIIQVKKKAICIKKEKEIREFIGLSESKEDESSPTQ